MNKFILMAVVWISASLQSQDLWPHNVVEAPADEFSVILQGLTPQDLNTLLGSSGKMLEKGAYCIVKNPIAINGLSRHIALNILELGILTPEELVYACQINPKLLDDCTSKTSVLEGHTGLVWGISWSPDGSQIAFCSWDCTVRIVIVNPLTMILSSYKKGQAR